MFFCVCFFFFFKQKTAYEMRISDWSSDVCSSDLQRRALPSGRARDAEGEATANRRLRGRWLPQERKGWRRFAFARALRRTWQARSGRFHICLSDSRADGAGEEGQIP